jgi:hypothetical protein
MGRARRSTIRRAGTCVLLSFTLGTACAAFSGSSPEVLGAGEGGADDGALPDRTPAADDGAADTSEPGDAAPPPPLGSAKNPAASCKVLHAAMPALPSSGYSIGPPGGPVFVTHCDMTSDLGGWTKVTPTIAATVVDVLRGGAAMGRQLLKCTDSASEYLESPSFVGPWQWAGAAMKIVAGEWRVSGVPFTCGSMNEYAGNGCMKWWGVGCGNGAGAVEKLYPGVLGAAPSGNCLGIPGAHANGNFNLCGQTNYVNYSVYVRAD